MSGAVHAKPGDVDPDFGVGCGPPVKFPPLADLAIGPDAKIYAIGRGLVARCLADGGVDPSFAGIGFGVYVPPVAFDFRAGAVAADGRLVVAGIVASGTGVAVMRLDADGFPDQSYGVYAGRSAALSSPSTAVDAIFAQPRDATAPSSANAWTRTAPDLLDIDLTDLKSLVRTRNADGTISGGAEWLDPALPGWDPTLKGPNGLPLAIHYGDMAGALPGPGGPDDYSLKLSNGSCPPKWGVETNGLHYLESCTDGTKEPLPQVGCQTCRLINWAIGRFSFPEVYYRFMVYAYPESFANQTELGIKLTGLGGKLYNGNTFAEIFELGKKTGAGWPLQAYRYDAEGAQGVTIFPQAGELVPGQWYTMEGRVKVPSAIGVKDGVMEFKLDGKLVFSRTDVDMGATSIQGFQVQLYHGGTVKPAGVLRYKTARVALSRKGWIGPAPELTQVSAIAALADGKVVVAGTSGSGAFLMRFAADGALDPSFGAGGIARTLATSFDTVNGLLLENDGKLLVLGARRSKVPTRYSVFALARFSADGAPDTSFGTNGVVSVDLRPTHNSSAFSAAQSPDGGIVVAGVVEADAIENAKVAIARLGPDGTVDASFGYGGNVLYELAGVRRSVLSLSPDGNIVVVASANPSYIMRFTASGQIDATFGLGGKTQVPSLASDAFAITQPRGKVVVGSTGFLAFSISRYLVDGPASRTDLTSTPNPSLRGQPVTLSATVAGQSPTGLVQFAELGVAIPGCGPAPIVATGAGAVATCTFIPASDGAHTLNAKYQGDSANPPSQSIDVQHVVSPVGTQAAIEFYDARFDAYFVTSNPNEVATLDDGRVNGWQRTGAFFSVWPLAAPGTQAVCRFFSGQKFAPKSSHFYTPYASECATARANPDWIYEGDVMGWRLPDASGKCAAGERPLYRVYNNGQGNAPNHRYYTDARLHAEMQFRGWVVEGNGATQVFACVP